MRLALGFGLLLLTAASAAEPKVALLSYLGGSGIDDCDGITVDRAGDIYLACHSDSPDFPGLSGKTAPPSRDAMDAIVVKIHARTGRLAWATRTGGSAWDAAGALTVARDGSIYVLGSTRSTDFPTPDDAVQRRFGGPDRDVFLLKLDPSGKIVYSTLLGGSKNDEATGLSVAEDGTVFIGGVTMSADFPGSRLAEFGPRGQQDAFIARIRPGDPHSLQTVLLGGKNLDHITNLMLDRSGHLFASGYTSSNDFPLKNAVQPHFGAVSTLSWLSCEFPTGVCCSPHILEAQKWTAPIPRHSTLPAIRSSPSNRIGELPYNTLGFPTASTWAGRCLSRETQR